MLMEPVYREGTLARILSRLKGFQQPKAVEEQYATPGSMAARLATLLAYQLPAQDWVHDLAAGTGILGLAMSLQGFPVRLYEKDPDAVRICKENIQFLQAEGLLHQPVECHETDVLAARLPMSMASILNPPFGTRAREKKDSHFLIRAFMHTRFAIGAILPPPFTHHARLAEAHGFTARLISMKAFPLPPIHPKHEKPRARTRVLLILFTRRE